MPLQYCEKKITNLIYHKCNNLLIVINDHNALDTHTFQAFHHSNYNPIKGYCNNCPSLLFNFLQIIFYGFYDGHSLIVHQLLITNLGKCLKVMCIIHNFFCQWLMIITNLFQIAHLKVQLVKNTTPLENKESFNMINLNIG